MCDAVDDVGTDAADDGLCEDHDDEDDDDVSRSFSSHIAVPRCQLNPKP